MSLDSKKLISDVRKTFYFRADANALGGFVEEPFQEPIHSQASTSLPSVGGYATARVEEFSFQKIVSHRTAYTRVSGKTVQEGGPWSMLVTSVIEGLNILEVITAERIVAQLSVEYSVADKFPRIVLTGSTFEKLKIGGKDVSPTINKSLLGLGNETEASVAQRALVKQVSHAQIGSLLADAKSAPADSSKWLHGRFEATNAGSESEKDESVLCSLVDGFDSEIPGKSYGHVLELPDFGRIMFGELLVNPTSIQLSMIRAELGCNVKGQVSAAVVGTGGVTFPP
jgi:hypothetical protein